MLMWLWRKENPNTLLVGMYIGVATMENNISFLKTLKVKLPFDPAILLLGINPKKCKMIQKESLTSMFTAALFIIAKIWKQLKCPSTICICIHIHTYMYIYV